PPRACGAADVAARPDDRTAARRTAAPGPPRPAAGCRLGCAPAAQPEVADRPGDGAVHGRRRADRAAHLGRAPERLQSARRAPGAVVAPLVRDDRPGERHLLA